jgi:hypothetical protein
MTGPPLRINRSTVSPSTALTAALIKPRFLNRSRNAEVFSVFYLPKISITAKAMGTGSVSAPAPCAGASAQRAFSLGIKGIKLGIKGIKKALGARH